MTGLACPAPVKQKSSSPAPEIDPEPVQASVEKDGGGGSKKAEKYRLVVVVGLSLFIMLMIIVLLAVNRRRKVIDINAVNDRQNSPSGIEVMGTDVVVPVVVQSSPPSVSPGHKRAGSARGSGSSTGGLIC